MADDIITETPEIWGAYRRVQRVDLQSLPLPFGDDEFDAVSFIGALTYFETADILRELCRVVRSGGHVVFSHRDDLVRDRDFETTVRGLERDGVWRRVFGTEPMPYLPRHPEYGDEIKVQYFVYAVVGTSSSSGLGTSDGTSGFGQRATGPIA